MRGEEEDGEGPMGHAHLWALHQLYLYYYLHDEELPLPQFHGPFAVALAELERSMERMTR